MLSPRWQMTFVFAAGIPATGFPFIGSPKMTAIEVISDLIIRLGWIGVMGCIPEETFEAVAGGSIAAAL